MTLPVALRAGCILPTPKPPPVNNTTPNLPLLTWLMLGLPCFFFEVVSSPQREENLLLLLLADLDMACVLLLTPDSPVRAATCQWHTASARELQQPQHTAPPNWGEKANPMATKASHCWDTGDAAFSLQINSLLPASHSQMDTAHHPHHFLVFNGRYFKGA